MSEEKGVPVPSRSALIFLHVRHTSYFERSNASISMLGKTFWTSPDSLAGERRYASVSISIPVFISVFCRYSGSCLKRCTLSFSDLMSLVVRIVDAERNVE
jgi:hypothetical protein